MAKDIFEYLSEIPKWTGRRDWKGLEEWGRSLAESLAGKEQAARIASADFHRYERLLADGLRKAVRKAQDRKANAIYFEYDLDNLWQSTIFICGPYRPESLGDDDWACDWLEDVEGPDFPELSELYAMNGFDRTDEAKGATIFLVARTVASFGRCFEREGVPDLAFCIAFHDQDPILRLQEIVPKDNRSFWNG